MREPGSGRRWLWPLGMLLVDCLLALALTWTIWRNPAGTWIGDSGDPHIMIWDLGLAAHDLITASRHPLFTDFIMYPTGVNLLWNTSLVFPGLVLSPVTILLGPVVAYNVLATSALAISAWFAQLVVRRYAASEVISAVAGILYGFSPYMILQSLGHTHLTIAVFPPLVWLLLDELLVRRRWHAAVIGVMLGAATTAQLLTSTEVLATTVLMAAVGVALLGLLHRSQVSALLPRVAVGGVAASLAILVLAAYPLKSLFFGPQRVSGVLNVPDIYVADALSFVVPPSPAYLGGRQAASVISHLTGNFVETGGAYLGILGLVALVLALGVSWRWPVVRFAGLLTIIVMVLSMGPVLHVAGHVTGFPLPWMLVHHLPLVGSAIAGRLSLFMWLSLAVTLGVAGGRLVALGGRGLIGALTAGLLFLGPIVPAPPLTSTGTALPAFFTTHGEANRIPKDSVALIAPFSNQDSSTAMYWQAAASFRFRMPEGEAYVPGPSLSPPPSAIQTYLLELESGSYPAPPPPDERAQAQRNLEQWNVDTIVVGPTRGEDRIVAFFTRVTGRQPERTGGVWVWWNVRSSRPRG